MSGKERTAQAVGQAEQAGDPTARLSALEMQMTTLLRAVEGLTTAIASQRPALAAPQKTERAQAVELVDEHCYRTRERHDDVWRWLYRQWQRYGHGDVYATAKRLGCDKLEAIDRAGLMGAFVDIVRRELPNKPGTLPSLPPVPPASNPGNPNLLKALNGKGYVPDMLAVAAGLSLGTIQKALRGYVPGMRARGRIAQALGASVGDLWRV